MCKTSAGTAAEKRPKSSLLARSALLLAILMFGAVKFYGHNVKNLNYTNGYFSVWSFFDAP